jgi:ribonuclease P protein component
MLPQRARLRRRGDFQRIYAAGKAYPDSCVVLHVLPLSDRPDECQVGFSVSKKVGDAVVRNRVKRRLREIVRPLLPRIRGGAQLVIAARSRSARADSAEMALSVTRALQRAGLLEHEVDGMRRRGRDDRSLDAESPRGVDFGA